MTIGLAGLAGILIGLLACWPIRHLPLGIDERMRQPAWTWRVTGPVPIVVMSGLCGVALGAVAVSDHGLVLALLVLALAVPAAAIDLRWRVVPDTLIVLGGGAAIAVLVALAPHLVVRHIAIAVAAGLGMGLLALASRGALGFGDVKLVAVLGLLLGWALPWALLIGTALAGLVAPAVLVRRGRRATVPLVPFLVAGALVASATGVGLPLGA